MKFHQTWFKPNNATLVVVGDTTLAEIQPKLEKLFGALEGRRRPEEEHRRGAAPAHGDVVYIVDKPGAIQSMIFAGHLAPPRTNPDEIADRER